MDITNPENDEGLTVEEEIAGGLRNAVERGQDLEKAMMSFASAGYDVAQINLAAQRMSGIQPMVAPQESTQGAVQQPTMQQAPTVQALPMSPIPTPKKSSKKLIIIMMIISALILVSAGLLGLYWPQLFP